MNSIYAYYDELILPTKFGPTRKPEKEYLGPEKCLIKLL